MTAPQSDGLDHYGSNKNTTQMLGANLRYLAVVCSTTYLHWDESILPSWISYYHWQMARASGCQRLVTKVSLMHWWISRVWLAKHTVIFCEQVEAGKAHGVQGRLLQSFGKSPAKRHYRFDLQGNMCSGRVQYEQVTQVRSHCILNMRINKELQDAMNQWGKEANTKLGVARLDMVYY